MGDQRLVVGPTALRVVQIAVDQRLQLILSPRLIGPIRGRGSPVEICNQPTELCLKVCLQAPRSRSNECSVVGRLQGDGDTEQSDRGFTQPEIRVGVQIEDAQGFCSF